jgi:hypothetical protein
VWTTSRRVASPLKPSKTTVALWTASGQTAVNLFGAIEPPRCLHCVAGVSSHLTASTIVVSRSRPSLIRLWSPTASGSIHIQPESFPSQYPSQYPSYKCPWLNSARRDEPPRQPCIFNESNRLEESTMEWPMHCKPYVCRCFSQPGA